MKAIRIIERLLTQIDYHEQHVLYKNYPPVKLSKSSAEEEDDEETKKKAMMIGRKKDEKKKEEEEKKEGEEEDKDPKKSQSSPCSPLSVTSLPADKFRALTSVKQILI